MNRGEFTRAVYDRLSIPVDGPRLTFGVAWAAYEGTEAKNNPWATTQRTNDSTDFNSDGVKNYPTFEQGVDATVLTLLDTDYAGLIRKLRNPDASVREIREALNASPWGSTVTAELFGLVSRRYDEYNTEVSGSGGDEPVPHIEEVVVTPKIEAPLTRAWLPTSLSRPTPAVETPKDEVAADADNVVPVPETPVEDAPKEANVEEVDGVETDTLESREAALATSEVEAAKTPEEVSEEPVATESVESSFKDKVVKAAEDFLTVLRSL